MKQSEEAHFRNGALPQTPRFCAFAPGFLDREASCARAPGIPAPESALELRLRRALPYAQVRSVYQGCDVKKLAVYTKHLSHPSAVKNRKKNISRNVCSALKPPRFIAFAPGFLDREASCA